MHGAPELVIELLSPSTSKYDLDEKKDVYERYGVKEYFIVEPTSKSLDHYYLENEVFIKVESINGKIKSKLIGCHFIF